VANDKALGPRHTGSAPLDGAIQDGGRIQELGEYLELTDTL
jgi:hypothetical protein